MRDFLRGKFVASTGKIGGDFLTFLLSSTYRATVYRT